MDRHGLDELMLRLQRGDEEAFEQLYNETRRGLFSFIISICKNYHTAEDLMQNTYIRLRTSIGTYMAGSNALAWLYTIAKNLTINELNKQKREIFADFEGADAALGGQYDMSDRLSGTLLKIIKEKLNGSEQQIIALYLVAGFKHREIALIMEKPLGTVLWSYRNALGKIKKELEKEEADED